MTRKKLLLGIGIAAAAVGAAEWLPLLVERAAPPQQAPAAARKQQAGAEKAVETRWSELPKREPLGKPAGELLFPHSWTPPPSQTAAAGAAAPPKPVAPAMPYRVAGKLVHEGRPQIVLAKGDR